MKIEVSDGEIIDKISILVIKLIKIGDSQKRDCIKKELISLMESGILDNAKAHSFFVDLIVVNAALWDIEDHIRIKERNKEFDSDFIKIARNVYMYNDKRFHIKDEINKINKSAIIEVKSYEQFQ